MEKLWDKAGELEGLAALILPVSQLGCPEKKKRKSSAQVSIVPPPPPPPPPPPLSEYAPPMNTSSDHLVASNPFDDEYSIPPLSGYTYFGKPGYGNIGGFNTFKIPPNSSLKRSSRNGGLQNFRDQPLPFPQEMKSMPLGRSFSIINIPEKSPFENEWNSGLGQTITMPGQHFRPNHNQDVFNTTSLNSGHRNILQPSAYRAQSVRVHFNQQPVDRDLFELVQPPFLHPKIPNFKQESLSACNIHCNPTAAEDQTNSDDFTQPTTDPLGSKKHRGNSGNFQPETIDLTNCGPANGAHSNTSLSKLSKSDVTSSEKCNRWLLQSSFSGPLSSDTVHPCGICSVEVNNIGDAIMCEVSCRKWFHRACTGMTEIAYALLTAETSAIWGCDVCMAKKDVQLVRIRK